MVTMAGRKEGLGSRGGLRDSRLLVAIAAGIILGAIWASIYPHGLFSGVSTTEKVDSLTSELEQKVAELSTRVNSLRRENEEMRDKLNIAQQEKDSAIQQLQASGGQLKPGPVGSVKSLRTNPPVAADESINPDLAKLLKKIAKNKEVLVGISNKNVAAMLKVWFTSIKQAGITNYLVIALDDEIYKFCKDHDVPAYRRDATIPKTLEGTGDNHAISGLKFHLLREFLLLGYGVLLSDVDIVYLQDPFKHLYRDCDIEAMTDGHNNATAYGYNDVFDDPKMGWSRYAHTMRIWVFNSGLFYLRPTIPAIELLDRVTTRLSNEKAWDQAVINEELFFPSHPGYEGLHASKRVMDRFLFMNSKALFVDIRKDPKYANFKPVSIHVNYHPDKYERMLGIVDYYSNGKKDALSRFPDGSE